MGAVWGRMSAMWGQEQGAGAVTHTGREG